MLVVYCLEQSYFYDRVETRNYNISKHLKQLVLKFISFDRVVTTVSSFIDIFWNIIFWFRISKVLKLYICVLFIY